MIAAQGVAQDAPVTSTDPLAQPSGAAELTSTTRGDQDESAPVITTEEQEAMTTLNADEDRAGVDLDTTEGQAQAMPVGGEAAVYEPGGDEDDDLIEGGEEYEEGDYDDELEGEGAEEGGAEDGGEAGFDAEGAESAEGETGFDNSAAAEAGAAGGEAGAKGIEGEDVYDEDADEGQEGDDQDPYGVDGYVEGIIGGNEEYDPEAEAGAEGMSCLNRWGEG